jgi:hypothetical protein
MVNSQNGWPVNPARRSRQVPGSAIKLVVADGPAGDLLLWFAGLFDQLVEDIDTVAGGVLDDWGWAERPIRGGTAISNHASATAIDLNATKHPLSAVGTFSAPKVRVIRDLLHRAGGAIRWGGDYTGRKDEMHFEINRDLPAVKAALARINGNGDDMATLDEILYEVRRTNDILFEGGGVPGRTARGTLRDEVERTNNMLFEGGDVPGNTDPGSMKGQLNDIQAMLRDLTGGTQ